MVNFLLRNFFSWKSTGSLNGNVKSEKAIENIKDALRDLIPFAQFKKLEKHPWRSVNFSKVAGFRLQI